MADPVIDKRIGAFRLGNWADECTPFCLLQVDDYEPSDETITKKKTSLLKKMISRESTKGVERTCNIGACTLKLVNSGQAREISGECRAATYCLKQSFEAVAKTATVVEGQVLYSDIIHSFEHRASRYSSGNFCPRLSCELSAGVSVDGVPGTAGSCILDSGETQ